MTRLLKGRTALVTGGGQGVGQGIARAMAKAGADIVIAQRRSEEAEREAAWIRENTGVRAFALSVDVTDGEAVNAMIRQAHEQLGKLEILVNNAGGSFAKRLENHTDDDMASSFDLNYWSAFRAMRAVLPIMKAQKFGRIINICSLNGINAHMFTAAYNASKEAVRTLTRTAAVEWGVHGITCNAICPAAMSPQARDYFEANPEMARQILSQIPVNRFGDAEDDIGPVAVFLASDGGGYVTGNSLQVDGGGHINGVAWRPEVEG